MLAEARKWVTQVIGPLIGYPTRTTDSHGRTDGRTKNVLTYVEQVTLVDARRDENGFATLGQVIEGGLWPTGERHPVIRSGERTPIPSHVRAAVWFRDGGRCRLCPPETKLGEWHLDHIKPWSAGGPDTTDNLRVLCAKHNIERSNQVIPDERPEVPVTWWCERCYMRDEHSWDYPTGLAPICPIHKRVRSIQSALLVDHRCPVQRLYARDIAAANETDQPYPDWHRREHGLTELRTTAYCAHCNLRGLTGVTL